MLLLAVETVLAAFQVDICVVEHFEIAFSCQLLNVLLLIIRNSQVLFDT